MTSGAPRPAGASGPLARESQVEVMQFFAERLARPVGLDVWTRHDTDLVLPDRDPCEHCADQLALLRQFVRLNPLISVTPYDIERHAGRAAEAGVDMTPTTIMRAGGRSLQFVGMAAGTLFPAFLDVMSYLSMGTTPLDDSSRAMLASLTAPVHLELLVAPYDNYSAHLMLLASALAAESRLVRLRIVDATEYPIFASLRGVSGVSGVPVLAIEGQRFTGVWDEAELVEQIWRIAGGNSDAVIRSQVYATPFITEAEARLMEAGRIESGRAAEAPGAPPMIATPPAGGLYIPGRD